MLRGSFDRFSKSIIKKRKKKKRKQMAFARASVIIRFFFFRKPGEWLTVEANNIIYAV